MFPDFSSGTLAKPTKPSTSAQHRVTPQVLTDQHPHQPEELKKYAEGRKKTNCTYVCIVCMVDLHLLENTPHGCSA